MSKTLNEGNSGTLTKIEVTTSGTINLAQDQWIDSDSVRALLDSRAEGGECLDYETFRKELGL